MCYFSKKLPVIAIAATMAIVSCNKAGAEAYIKEAVTKVADYLYELEAEGYGTEAPATILTDDGPLAFACSTVRNGNFYGRNLDLSINEICEFIVRTKATAERKHASIGVSNPVFRNMTGRTAVLSL